MSFVYYSEVLNKILIMTQTLTGATVENGKKLKDLKTPEQVMEYGNKYKLHYLDVL